MIYEILNLSSNSLYNIVTFHYNGDFKITTKQQQQREKEEKVVPSHQKADNRINTLLSLRIDPFYIVKPGSNYGLSGKLTDSDSNPLRSKKITFRAYPKIILL